MTICRYRIAGAIFWQVLGGAGFCLSERTWCVLVLSVAIVATPIAIILFKKLVSHLTLKSPLATLISPALLPVALSLGIAAAAAFDSNLSLVPLVLMIGWHHTGPRLAGYMRHRYLRCMPLSASCLQQRSGFCCLKRGLRYCRFRLLSSTRSRHFGFYANCGA